MSQKQLVEQIKSLYYDSQFDECMKLVDEQSSTDNYDDHRIALLYKSTCFLELGKYNLGFDSFTKLIEYNDQNRKTDHPDDIEVIIRSFQQWQIYFENADKAVIENQSFKKVIDDYKDHCQTKHNYNEGAYLFGYGTYQMVTDYVSEELDESINQLKQAKDKLKDYEQDLMPFISWVYFLANENQKGLDYINELYKINPKFPQILNYIAIYQNRLEMFDESEKNYLQIINEQPNNIIFLNNCSHFYYKRNNIPQAREYIERSFNIDQENSYTCSLYSSIMLDLGYAERSRDILIEGIKKNPLCTQLLIQLSKLELEEQNFSEQIKNLEKCIAINPLDNTYFIYLGLAYSSQGEYEISNEILFKSLQLKQSALNKNCSLCNIGMNYFELLQYKKSLENFLKSYQLNLGYEYFDDSEYYVQQIIDNREIAQCEIIELIDQQYGYFPEKIEQMIQSISNQEIILHLLYKQNVFKQIMLIMPYKKQILPYLSFQKEYSHWDLFIE